MRCKHSHCQSAINTLCNTVMLHAVFHTVLKANSAYQPAAGHVNVETLYVFQVDIKLSSKGQFSG